MKKSTQEKQYPAILAILLSLAFYATMADNRVVVSYTIHMTGSSTDTFDIEVDVPRLGNENNLYQFASTAPGTYSVMDIGRYVSDFKAFDKKGREISVKHVSVNQFVISNPKKVRKITYRIAETWDTHVSENYVYPMGGSSLEKDHALLNMHCLIGYFNGMQDADLEISLNFPSGWKMGTSFPSNSEGILVAGDFDFAVDSPVLLGRLSDAELEIDGKKIEIYTYSKTDMIKSSELMENMKATFEATNTFVKGFPIDRYVLLFHFEDQSFGAWEHSYSSEYVFQEQPLTKAYLEEIKAIASHEIFHMVTPLNIHSNVIEQFNFVTPTPSRHLWLYEGLTEWASHMILLRGGLISLNDMLETISEKLNVDDTFDKSYSLQKLAYTSYTDEGKRQYMNVYYRGALVPLIMDIMLLEKSGGKRGLREVVMELTEKYGPDKAFSEEGFINEFITMTDPEMKGLFERYIINADPLPIEEYMGKLGIRYHPEVKTGEEMIDLGYTLQFDGTRFFFSQVSDKGREFGLRENDVMLTFNSIEATPDNISSLMPAFHRIKPGDSLEYRVLRGEEEHVISLLTGTKERVFKHVLEIDSDATAGQVRLREAWMKNQ